MKLGIYGAALAALLMTACATPPSADPSTVEAACAQQCSSSLATCSSGFKLFPVVAQKQCNDTYDVCIKGCPARDATASSGPGGKLKVLDALLKSGEITKEEYDGKRKQVIDAM
jgi:hypothetical protein